MKTNKEIGEIIERKLINKFGNDTIFNLVDFEEYLYFNYPNYFDGIKSWKQTILDQFDFLISMVPFLRKLGFSGFYFVGDYFINVH